MTFVWTKQISFESKFTILVYMIKFCFSNYFQWMNDANDLCVCLFVWRCLTSLSTIFQLYSGGQFYWCRKPTYQKPVVRTNLDIYGFFSYVVQYVHHLRSLNCKSCTLAKVQDSIGNHSRFWTSCVGPLDYLLPMLDILCRPFRLLAPDFWHPV